MALITFMDKLTNAIENGEYVTGIFLGFSKAFDTVNHDILLEKLEHYGIRVCALLWFRSYLSNRPQYVTYNGTASMSHTIKCGVPQGSILGPLLFLIYINDLGNVWINTMPLLFADDTNLFSCDQAALQMVFSVCLSVCLSVRPSVTPFSLCYPHRIIVKFSGVITNDRSKVHAKGQGQRSKVKVTEVKTQLNHFRTVTPGWINIWWWNDAHSLMLLRRGVILLFKVIRQISRSHC